MDALTSLIKNLSKIPGMGTKSATRVAYFLLNTEQNYNSRLAEEIKTIQEKIKYCSLCGRFTEEDPCPICCDTTRNRQLICVVEDARDVQNMESTGEFKGLYHVLGGVISPIDGIGPEQLRIKELTLRIQEQQCQEVIIATNPTVEGDTTAFFLTREIAPLGIQISRLASGLPVGGDLEYADRLTLTRSLKGRITITPPKEF